MKPGITLIEVALSILLGSLVSSALFMSFSQLQIATQITDSFIEIDMRSTVMAHQMSRDITGACVPEHSFRETEENKKETSQTDDKKSDDKKEESKDADKEKASKTLDLGTVFMVKHKNKNIDMITCITNNPVAVYDTVKPSLARVVYRLQPDKEHEGTFRLVRQESENLELSAFDKGGTEEVRAYELARNIKSCTCKCTFLEYAQEKEDQPKKVTKRDVPDWIYNPKKASEDKMPALPYALIFHTVFWDDQHRREWPTEFIIPIAAFQPYSEKKKDNQQKKPQEGSKEGQKKEAEPKKESTNKNNSMSVMDLFRKDIDKYKSNNKILSKR